MKRELVVPQSMDPTNDGMLLSCDGGRCRWEEKHARLFAPPSELTGDNPLRECGTRDHHAHRCEVATKPM
jgi:hypothetical protein